MRPRPRPSSLSITIIIIITTMILGPVSYVDCLVFCIFLAPQLLIHVGVVETAATVLQCLPFLLFELPVGFVRERYLVGHAAQPPFVRRAAPFEDLVIRCVRYAFANLEPKVGRVFFSKPVALPFLRFRMLRHGYLKSPVHWREYKEKRFRGIWIVHDPMRKPDICLYYAHGEKSRVSIASCEVPAADHSKGGGFSMGSSFFYLEYLLTWLGLLVDAGYQNPAIFALEYTLVPDGTFPRQLEEAIAGYEHVLSWTGDPEKICVSGDSAGATIVLSLLLHLANLGRHADKMDGVGSWRLPKPGLAVLISPWVTLVSDKHRNTPSDYLDASHLHRYARQYSGEMVATDDPLLSPGDCKDVSWWNRACPSKGIFVGYGAEEVFAPEVERLVAFFKDNGIEVRSQGEAGGIHAWPVASLFLCSLLEERKKGLKVLVQEMRENIQPGQTDTDERGRAEVVSAGGP
ncbi:alpha/beta-hydrolase [Xylariaceae sp. FL0804]|nr:alpha/beta-hydrolase [Xylariaceae sp. FL0804]